MKNSAALAACASACALSATLSTASAQEAINTTAAVQPSQGVLYMREQLRFTKLGDDPTTTDPAEQRDGWRAQADTSFIYGLRSDLAISITLPFEVKRIEQGDTSETDFGLGDATLLAKYRIWKADTSPIDTARLSLFAGAEFSLAGGAASSESVDPIIGAVLTVIRGRHGFTQAFQYKFNTGNDAGRDFGGDGPDDAFRSDSANLFRLSPAAYTAESTSATYAVLELNYLYETGGDQELFLSPGILYEAQRWALELGVQIPIAQDVDERPETEYAVVAGLRVFF